MELEGITAIIFTAILGIFLIIIGYFNTKGNINSLHWYHRQRVTEEDRIPFGKKVGLGTIIIGICLELFSLCSLLGDLLENDLLVTVGSAITVCGVVVGCILMFAAMIKYNKGIF